LFSQNTKYMADVKKTDLIKVKYGNLKVIEGNNIRQDYGDIPLLANQILEHGVKVPLQGHREKGTDIFIIKDGHRRYAALTHLKDNGLLPEDIWIPFVLEPQKYNDEQRVIDMFILNEGKALTPLEQAEGVRRMQNWGYTDKDIAQKIGRSQAYVSKLSSLNAAPKKMINLIEKGTIAASFAIDIIAKGETDKFLQDVEAGTFEQKTNNGHEIFPSETATKTTTKITKGDLQTVNSWKEFKKFAKDADEKMMDEEKAKIFKWLCKMMNNELTEDHFKRYFK
jgi:ParB/RepB/Spo0J family partition protein